MAHLVQTMAYAGQTPWHELPQSLHSGHTLARLSEGVGLPNLPH